jgi:hypothetical protein
VADYKRVQIWIQWSRGSQPYLLLKD